MLVKHKKENIVLHTWDYKSSPSFNALYSLIKKYDIKDAQFQQIITGSDDDCVIITEGTCDIQKALEIYKSYYNDSFDEHGDWINLS